MWIWRTAAKTTAVTVELPGFSKADVNIEVAEDAVKISAKKTASEEEKNKNYIRRERSAQTYYRRIQLPEKVVADNAKANLKDGVLEITLPKKEPKETKKLHNHLNRGFAHFSSKCSFSLAVSFGCPRILLFALFDGVYFVLHGSGFVSSVINPQR